MLILILEFFLILFSPIKAAQLIQGDTANSTQSFSFPIGLNKIYRSNGMLFIAAKQAVPENNFAISFANINDSNFKGLTFSTVNLNNVAAQTNPLNGAQINQMALLENFPVVVKNGEGSTIYMINQFDSLNYNPQNVAIVSAQNIHDASGVSNTSNIIGLETAQHGKESNLGFVIFAAVNPAVGNFGTGDSGIAMLEYAKINGNFGIKIFDAQTGVDDGNKAVQLNVSTPAAKINNDLTAITNTIVDMHWDDTLSRLYIALQGQSGAIAGDGIRAVVMAYVQNNQLILSPIAPDSAIAGTNQIIAGTTATTGTSVSVNVDKIRTMKTSTYLQYLITTNSNQVFALPLVNNASSYMGTIADKNQTAVMAFNNKGVQSFISRVLINPATTPAQMPTSSDIAAVVGQGNLPANVQDIFVSGDAIFVAVAQNGIDQQPGIFHSQAIFGSDGSVVNWTPWQRTYAAGQSILGVNQDINTTRTWFLTGTSQIASDAFNVQRTFWDIGEANISKVLQSEFPQAISGVQGVFDFPYNTAGFSASVGNRISINVFTGFNKVLLLQSGSDTNNLFGPTINFGQVNFSSNDGTLSNLVPSNSNTGISIANGALTDIGPIISAQIITDGNYGWLCVGGVGGIAVLCDENGAGWNASTGLQQGFIGLNNNFSFKKVGYFKNVRKLIARNGNLYVLSDESLDRFAVSAFGFKTNNLNSVQLADPEILQENLQGYKNTYFSDFIVKDQIALLGTSSGLLRTGPNTNLDNINDVFNAQWTFLKLPEGVGPVTRFYNIIADDNAYDPTNIYILNSYVGLQQTRVYRAYLNNDVFLLLPDLFINNTPSFLLNVGTYRNYLATDGANLFISRSRFINNPPIFEFYKLNNISSSLIAPKTAMPVLLNINNFKSLTNLIKNSANGSWMLAGRFWITGTTITVYNLTKF